jgi:hypothetical protein
MQHGLCDSCVVCIAMSGWSKTDSGTICDSESIGSESASDHVRIPRHGKNHLIRPGGFIAEHSKHGYNFEVRDSMFMIVYLLSIFLVAITKFVAFWLGKWLDFVEKYLRSRPAYHWVWIPKIMTLCQAWLFEVSWSGGTTLKKSFCILSRDSWDTAAYKHNTVNWQQRAQYWTENK